MADPEGTGIQSSAAAVRLLLEGASLIVLGVWGYSVGETQLGKVAVGIGVPLAVSVVWSLFGSPAAPYRLEFPLRVGLEVLILGGATLALARLGQPALAGVFAVVAAVDTVLLYRDD